MVDEPDMDAKGAAIAGMALSMSLMSFLQGKGIINDEQAEQLLEGALRSLEAYQVPNDPGVQSARKIVEAMALTISKNRAKKGR